LAVPREFIDMRPAVTPMRDHQLQVDKTGEVDLQLCVAPAAVLAHLPPREPDLASITVASLNADVGVEIVEQSTGLRWQLIERAAEDIVGDTVGDLDVGSGGFDVDDLDAINDHRRADSLVLMQKRDRPNQRQIFGVIATRPGGCVGESELLGERVDDRDRLQESLGVLVDLDHPVTLT